MSNNTDLTGNATFFALPVEVRIRIYRLCTIMSHPIEIRVPWSNRVTRFYTVKGWAPPKPAEPSLAFINRQLRQEVLEVFYGENWFQLVFDHPFPATTQSPTHGFAAWCQRLGPTRTRFLRRVRIELEYCVVNDEGVWRYDFFWVVIRLGGPKGEEVAIEWDGCDVSQDTENKNHCVCDVMSWANTAGRTVKKMGKKKLQERVQRLDGEFLGVVLQRLCDSFEFTRNGKRCEACGGDKFKSRFE